MRHSEESMTPISWPRLKTVGPNGTWPTNFGPFFVESWVSCLFENTGPGSINPIRLTFSIGLGEITILIAFTSSINAIKSDISNPRFEILINLAKWIGLLVSGRFHYALKLYVSLPGIAKDRYSIEWSGTLFILIGNIRSWIGKSQSTSSRSIKKSML